MFAPTYSKEKEWLMQSYLLWTRLSHALGGRTQWVLSTPCGGWSE
jgi:hypothetical protein